MKTSFKRYLYIFSIMMPAVLLYNLIFIFTAPYDGGIKQFDELNRILPYVSTKVQVIIPFINQLLPILTVLVTLNKTNDSSKDNDINPIYIFLAIFTHFTPVFNPIVCIITNKPYKEAVFNRLKIHPQ
ncbi:unnamed protein product [Meloidogyne enterolobii]|uniref:Uncharacterized protein n=1 Tax=Meloidogyne enterolobii TaxID=390850 RepID=A0ACB0Y3A9_MELEN